MKLKAFSVFDYPAFIYMHSGNTQITFCANALIILFYVFGRNADSFLFVGLLN